MTTAYRPCVLVVFTNDVGQVLVAERADHRGQWQFPQGGIEDDETPEAAAAREAWEELGTREFVIGRRAAEPVAYDFPPGLSNKIAKRWRGQLQTWFLARFTAGGAPNLAQAPDAEFVATKWVSPQAAIDGAVAFKRQAYVAGMRQLGFEVH